MGTDKFFTAINFKEFGMNAKLIVEQKKFTLFTKPMIFLRYLYIVYVEINFHMTVPLKKIFTRNNMPQQFRPWEIKVVGWGNFYLLSEYLNFLFPI